MWTITGISTHVIADPTIPLDFAKTRRILESGRIRIRRGDTEINAR